MNKVYVNPEKCKGWEEGRCAKNYGNNRYGPGCTICYRISINPKTKKIKQIKKD